jgi:hypothetical protein
MQAERTSRKASLADRLVNGLSGENKRWTETVQKMEVTGNKLVRCVTVPLLLCGHSTQPAVHCVQSTALLPVFLQVSTSEYGGLMKAGSACGAHSAGQASNKKQQMVYSMAA